ncbi:MAG: RNA polymerase sigma factor [Massilia sp.]|nr:RNA polymerase sigma factor [Massilia sp.]
MHAATHSPSALDDDGLLHRIRAGDRDAFTLLMRRYNRRLYRVARSVLRDDAEAEDALQDAYLQAYRALPAFRGDAALGTWLTRIVVNAALMRQRKTGRLAEIIELGADYGADDAPVPHGVDDGHADAAQPELAALRAQTRRLIETGIDKLPTVFRTVFVLRAVEELTVEETAATLDIPEATVRTRYFRARALLREALAREIDFAIEDAFGFDGARCDRIVQVVQQRIAADPSS